MTARRRGQAAAIDLLAAAAIAASLMILLYAYVPPAPPRSCRLHLDSVLADGGLADCISTPGCNVADYIWDTYGAKVYVQLYTLNGSPVGAWGDSTVGGGAVRGLVALRNGTVLVIAVRC